ncbi:MAG TPA: matrixin family metalloprotease [Thermoanaerobaculia bacterium]|nr:matrixin family metalloprotease [Thermoanaerobaculia bacterium]
MTRKLPALAVFLLVATALPAVAGTRLTYVINGSPKAIYWPQASLPLQYKIDQRVVNAMPEAKQVIERAFAAWAGVTDGNLQFQDDGVANALSARNDSRNVITLSDDLFANQGCIALTTYTFDTSGSTPGRLTDADIQLDASLFRGGYNAEMAIEHEIGHMIGLDHSAVLSAIMYPYVSKGAGSPVLDSDDRVAVATSYPKADDSFAGGTLSGRVVGDGGGIFAAQVVALSEQGEPVATALTNSVGEFTLSGLPNGRYRVYAEPLDGPVDVSKLEGVWRQAKVQSFPTQFLDGDPIEVTNGKVIGNLIVSSSGVVRLNPKWVGVTSANGDLSLSSTPISLKPGDNVTLAVAGDGFTSSMTQFEVLNPAFRRTSDFTWSGNYVSANYAIAPNASSTSAVILVKSGNETATLTGALRVRGAQGPTKSRAVRR